MSRHNPQVRLQHMLEYAREAVALMRGKTRGDLDTDRALGLATLRCLEIIGEAASRVPETMRQQAPNIPWNAIVATRDRLVHGYDLVDYDIIWSTITEDLRVFDCRTGEDRLNRRRQVSDSVKSGELPPKVGLPPLSPRKGAAK